MLLLNSSNFKLNLCFPYAFVQVSEIARRYNIDVKSIDLFDIKKEDLEDFLVELIKEKNYNFIGITLRNSDTCNYHDYYDLKTNLPLKNDINNFYFPILSTKETIDILRKITNIPVILGGFGFSIMPRKLMNYLKPDFGIIGGPDSVFANFNNLMARINLDLIENLVYWEGNNVKFGPKFFFPPASNLEYTESIIEEVKDFMCKYQKYDIVDSVAIEISRGCAFSCNFCSEPFVNGHTVQFRNPNAIKEDIELLGLHGLNKLFFICSEMNTPDNKFILSLAMMIKNINEKRDKTTKLPGKQLI